MNDLEPFFAGILGALVRPIAKSHHAPQGGEVVNGETFAGGEFTPEHAAQDPENASLQSRPSTTPAQPAISPAEAQRIRLGMASMKSAVTGKDVRGGCYRGKDGIGWVDFLWGREGGGPPDFPGGYGIAKEVAKRSYEHEHSPDDPSAARTLAVIPMVIVLGKAQRLRPSGPDETDRVTLEQEVMGETYRVVLSKSPTMGENHWLLSGYEVRAKRKPSKRPGRL